MAILVRATNDNTKYGAKKGEYYCGNVNKTIYVFDSNPDFARDMTTGVGIPEGFEYIRYNDQPRVPQISS